MQQRQRRLEVLHGWDALKETVMVLALEPETPLDVGIVAQGRAEHSTSLLVG